MASWYAMTPEQRVARAQMLREWIKDWAPDPATPKPGQAPPSDWWARYMSGELTTPQQICAAATDGYQGMTDPDPRFFGAPPDVKDVWQAPERLQAHNFLRSTGHDQQHLRADWAYVDLRLAYWAAHFIFQAKRRGIPLYVHSALRDKATQDAHYANGTSKLRYPRSAHNIGEAVDIVHGLFHWEMTRQEWSLLGVLGRLSLERVNAMLPKARRLSLTWGGDWKFYDPAHWEISDYRPRLRTLTPHEPMRRTPVYLLQHLNPMRNAMVREGKETT